MASNSVTCPFCGSFTADDYNVQLHIEEYHTDNSPFVVRHVVRPTPIAPATPLPLPPRPRPASHLPSDSMPGDMWTRCTRAGCGEHVLLSEIDEHLDFHEATDLSNQLNHRDMAPPLPPRPDAREPADKKLSHEPSVRFNLERREMLASKVKDHPFAGSLVSYVSATSTSTLSTLRKLKPPTNPGRLGKRELGPYAFEKNMPSAVRKILIAGGEPRHVNKIGRDGRLYKSKTIGNETSGLIPVLADVLALEEKTVAAYLCHPSTRHIHKLECDGNFCGYWNIMVLMTYVQHVDPHRAPGVPHVIQIQETIEQAWDNDICSYGKIETGGVLNTRKWIGTNEALAYFTQVGVPVEALMFKGGEGSGEHEAVEDLLDHVEAYFMSGLDAARKHGSSFVTQLAPMFFQRLGHSMTIVGLERLTNGSRNLLVFDSSFATSKPLRKLLDGRDAHASPEDLLKVYRRSNHSLTRWSEFEILVPSEASKAAIPRR